MKQQTLICLASCMLFSFLCPPTARGEQGPPAQIAVTVFACTEDSGKPPTLRIADIDRTFASVATTPRWIFEPPSWQTVVAVPAGHYIVSSASEQCGGETEQIVAIPGITRHIAITLNQKCNTTAKSGCVSIDEDMFAGAIYGVIPHPTARVEIMSADSIIGEQTRSPARVDGNIFEFDHLRPGSYILRISIGDVLASHEVVVPKGVYGPTVRVDFTAQELQEIAKQQTAGSGFVDVATYSKERAQTFRLGSATVAGWVTDPMLTPSDYSTGLQRINPPVAHALLVAHQFLISDQRFPKVLKSLSDWSIAVQGGGWPQEILIDFKPIDLSAWLQDGPRAPENCLLPFEKHYFRLAINNKTWKVDEVRICP